MDIIMFSIDLLLVNCVAGGLSGITEVILTHPLDVLKTHTQNNRFCNDNLVNTSGRLNFYKSIYNIYGTHGMLGYYRGLFPRLCGIVPMRFMYWGVQNTLNQKLLINSESLQYRTQKLIFAGAVGAIAQTLIDNPIEVMKIRMVTDKNANAKDIMHSMIKSKSCPGFCITLARNIPFAICTNIGVHLKDNNTMQEKFIYGAFGGFIGSIITQPIDFIKTRVQSKSVNQNTYDLILSIARTNPRLLWTGWVSRSILGFFNMGIGAIAFYKFKAYYE